IADGWPVCGHPSRVLPLPVSEQLMAATAAGIRISLVAATILAATSAPAADTWQIGGNLRVGYVASETRARDGAESDADSFRTRARVHLRADPGNGWRFGVRVAGRFDSGQD